ncbi:MAG: AAA family ATPase [Candidatus Bathyarchaeia archaeon]
MQPQRIVDYVSEWMSRSLAVGVERELKVPWRKDKIISIIGPRRAGKTYYFYQLISRDRMGSLYLNFEDTRLYVWSLGALGI